MCHPNHQPDAGTPAKAGSSYSLWPDSQKICIERRKVVVNLAVFLQSLYALFRIVLRYSEGFRIEAQPHVERNLLWIYYECVARRDILLMKNWQLRIRGQVMAWDFSPRRAVRNDDSWGSQCSRTTSCRRTKSILNLLWMCREERSFVTLKNLPHP